MRTGGLAVGLIIAGFLAACGGAQIPTQPLVDARLAYEQASTGNAAQYAPGTLLEARRALDAAEIAYRDDVDDDYQAHLAYVALRRAQAATARGDEAARRAEYERRQAARTAAVERDAATAKAAQAKAESELRQRDAELAQREADLQMEQLARERGEAALARTAETARVESEARVAAEREKSEALESLRQLAAIQETERGLVITLAGSLLFRTDETTLLPVAKERLDQVALALRKLAGGQTLVVEGHTDSVGTSEYNRALSAARAEAVRAYLVSKGVPPERVVAVAKGEEDPVAPNSNAEGRANNRRVEIVISRPSVPGPG